MTTKSKLRSAVALAAALLATPAVARTNSVTPRPVVVQPSQVEAVSPGRYKLLGYAPITPAQNRNLDPSNYGGDSPPDALKP